MPPLLPFVPIITALGSAAGAGVGIYEAANQPSAPKPATNLSPTQADQAKAAVAQQVPDIVSQTGGAVSPAYTQLLAELNSGTANLPGIGGLSQDAVNQFFGLGGGGGGGGGVTGSAPSLTSPSPDAGAGVAGFQPSATGGGSAGSGGVIDSSLSDLIANLGR
jgi:hypothetical protein